MISSAYFTVRSSVIVFLSSSTISLLASTYFFSHRVWDLNWAITFLRASSSRGDLPNPKGPVVFGVGCCNCDGAWDKGGDYTSDMTRFSVYPCSEYEVWDSSLIEIWPVVWLGLNETLDVRFRFTLSSPDVLSRTSFSGYLSSASGFVSAVVTIAANSNAST